MKHPIIPITILLLGAFFVLPLLDDKEETKIKEAPTAKDKFPTTGFPDYDLLPAELKQRMEELMQEDSSYRYQFAYYFEVDDINRHFYLDDDPKSTIVAAMPVKSHKTLALVEERMQGALNRRGGHWMEVSDEIMNIKGAKEARKVNKTRHQMWVEYIFTTGEVDFTKLRAAIFKDTIHRIGHRPREIPDTQTYRAQSVDQFPAPVRGMAYLHDALQDYFKEELVYFKFYDMEGDIKAEFTVGRHASSPQIIEGFSTRETDRDEAYKLDGLIVKSLNNLKVRWQPGLKDGKEVNTRIGMTFTFTTDESGNLNLSMSALLPATHTF